MSLLGLHGHTRKSAGKSRPNCGQANVGVVATYIYANVRMRSFVFLPVFQTSSSCWRAAFALLPPRSDSSRKRARGAGAVTERMLSECAWASSQTARAGVGRLGKRRFLKGRKKKQTMRIQTVQPRECAQGISRQ